MNTSREGTQGVAIGVALIALSTLLFEVLLTRIFAVTMWYHFGFLAISLALLGTATSAVLCYVYPERLVGERYRENLTASAFGFAVLAPVAVSVHLHSEMPSLDAGVGFVVAFGAQLVLFFGAFTLAGLCISIALFRFASQVNKVYAYDLVGAAIGSVAVVPLLYSFSGPAAVFVASLTASAAAFVFARPLALRRLSGVLLAAILIAFSLALLNDRLGLLAIENIKSYGSGSVQTREAEKVFEKWSPVSRVAVHRPEMQHGQEVMLLTADGGAPTVLRRFDDHDDRRLAPLDADSRQAVHALKRGAKVLVIGSAGGTDVMAALRSGQSRVTAVEINPITVEVVTGRFAAYIGDVFHDPRVTLHMHEGRNFTAGSRERFDIVQITMIDSWAGAAAGAYIFNENSLYTLEAMRDYWRHLEPGGILSVTRYVAWDEALRLTNMMVEFLQTEGIRDIGSRLAILAEPFGVMRRATVLLKKGAFTPEELGLLRGFAARTKASVVHVSVPLREELENSTAADNMRRVIALPLAGEARAAVLSRHRADISAPTDDRPFFFFTGRLRDAFRPDPTAHASRRLAMPLLYGMLIGFTLVGLLVVILPLYLRSGAALRSTHHPTATLAYFALLGLGYLLVEISLIQRLTVFLGHPTWSFVAVLSTMLCASGIGSRFSERLPQAPRSLVAVLVSVATLVAFYVLVVYDQFIDLMWLSRSLRVLLAVAVVGVPGFLMGMCFPIGIQIARRRNPILVPWGWGVNGAFSVLAPILAIALSLNFGLKLTLTSGGLCYAAACGIVLAWRRGAGGSDGEEPGRTTA